MNKRDLVGRWRIEDMSGWDSDYFNMDQPAHLKLTKKGLGGFVFGLVQAELDGRFTTRDGRPLVEFTWSGVDEDEPVCGRGWAALIDEDAIEGQLFIHLGDNSSFRAKRWK